MMKSNFAWIWVFSACLAFDISADQLWSRSASSVSRSGDICRGLDRESLRSNSDVESLIQRCLKTTLSEAPANTFRKTDDGRFSVVAWQDMIFLEKVGLSSSSEFKLIRAKNPDLNRIKAVATDSSREELYVLDEDSSGDTQLLVYKLRDSGDQSPLRMVRGPSLKGADSLSLDPVRGYLYLGHRLESKITVLRQLATIHHGGKEIHNPEPIKVHSLAQSPVPNPSSVSVDPKTQNIYIYDNTQSKAVVLKQGVDKATFEPLEIGERSILTLNVHASKRKLELLTTNGLRRVSLVD